MTVNIILLPDAHPRDCPVCGGHREVKVSGLRWRHGNRVASWPSRIVPCPAWSGADDLRGLLPQDTPDSGGVA